MRSFFLIAIISSACSSNASENSPSVQTASVANSALVGERPAGETKLEFTAAVVSDGDQIVSAVASGRIEALSVRVGDVVEAGQTLGHLDLDGIQSRLDVAIAARSSAQAARSKASIEVQEAGRQVALSRKLFREEVRSKESVNQASFGLKRAHANLREFGGVVNQYTAQIEELRTTLSQSVIQAKVSGVVASLYSQAGQRIQRGQKLLRIVDLDSMAVRFAIPDTAISKVESGSKVMLTIPGNTIPLVVVSVTPDIDPGLRLAFALAKPENPDDLRDVNPGITGRVSPISP